METANQNSCANAGRIAHIHGMGNQRILERSSMALVKEEKKLLLLQLIVVLVLNKSFFTESSMKISVKE